MDSRTNLPCLALFGLALLPTAQAQQQTRIPGPPPPALPDKVAPEETPNPPPILPPHVMAPARAKPAPAGAPEACGLRFALDRAQFSEPGDGRVWVRGEDYKSSFGAEGATFIPFLGSSAPRNYPVRFALAEASVGGAPLAFASTASVRRDGERVILDRGDVDEVFDVALASVEQTIVIERLPARGALHLEIGFESELQAGQEGDGIEFTNELGGVRYGSVTVLDAAGARFDTASRLVDGAIHVDVPADFMAGARLPLRVDPVISTVNVFAFGGDQYYGDIAYDVSNDRWCVVFEHAFSATDHDIYTEMVDSSGALIGGQFATIDSSGDFWAQPRIANNNSANNFMVVAVVTPAGGGSSVIKGATRDAGSTSVSGQFVVSGLESGVKQQVDIGGDSFPNSTTYYCVVYQRIFSGTDTDVHARLLSATGVVVGSTIFVDNSGGTLDSNPRISNSNGASTNVTWHWNIVWERYDAFLNDGNIHGAQVRWNGVLSTPSFPIDVSPSFDAAPVASSPLDRSSGPLPWMVVYQRLNFASGLDLFGRVLEGSTLVGAQQLTQNEGINVNEDQLSPDVDSDGSQFVVSFLESFLGSSTDYDVYASAFWYADGAIGTSESHMLLDYSDQASLFPTIAAAHSSGATSRRFGASWSTYVASGGTYDPFAGILDAPGDVPVLTHCAGSGSNGACPCGNQGQPGYGCGHSTWATGALLTGGGVRNVSNDSFVMVVYDLPPGAPCLFFQGTAPAAQQFGDGILCVGGSIVRLGVAFPGGGVTVYPGASDPLVSVSGSIPAIGANRYYQGWFRDAAAFCTASTFNLTNGIQAVWLP